MAFLDSTANGCANEGRAQAQNLIATLWTLSVGKIKLQAIRFKHRGVKRGRY